MPPSECPELSHFPADQDHAIQLLARGYRKSNVARAVGVDRRTITRWLDRKSFQDAIADARDDVLADLSAAYVGLAPLALHTLTQLMLNHADKPAAAFRAALLVMKKSGLDRAATPPPADLRGLEIELGVITFDREGHAFKGPPENPALPPP